MQSDAADGDSRQITPTTFTVSQLIELLQPYSDLECAVAILGDDDSEFIEVVRSLRIELAGDGQPTRCVLVTWGVLR